VRPVSVQLPNRSIERTFQRAASHPLARRSCRTLGPNRMRRTGTLSPPERGLAVGLAVLWLCGGAFALYFALIHSRWGMGLVALTALIYGAAWLRVAALSRLLTWPELIAPWRRV
jgi:hypothetical protein